MSLTAHKLVIGFLSGALIGDYFTSGNSYNLFVGLIGLAAVTYSLILELRHT